MIANELGYEDTERIALLRTELASLIRRIQNFIHYQQSRSHVFRPRPSAMFEGMETEALRASLINPYTSSRGQARVAL